MGLPAYAGLSPAELGRVLGLEEEHKGARPDKTDWSMHLFGLAIVISCTRNPWVSNPKRDTARLAEITLRAARLTGWSGAGEHGISARLLHGLATTHGDTAKVYSILGGWTRALADSFKLAGDVTRIHRLLPTANAIFPGGGWFNAGESLAVAAVQWSRKVQADLDDFAKAVGRGGKNYDVRHEFMDLPRDLVIALRNDACLGWGAVDLGTRASGDVMHFDCRMDGIGRTIATTSGKPFVPTSVFVHGDPDPCAKTFDPNPRNVSKKFGLDAQSHAYAILSPLGCEFNRDAPATKTGALAKLDQVWALDSTYGPSHVRALEAWANKFAAGHVVAVLSKNGARNRPLTHWNRYYAAAVDSYCPAGLKPPANLRMCAVDPTHCEIPGRYVGSLLSIPRHAPDWCAALG